MVERKEMRKFEGGATRNNNAWKLNYTKGLSARVLRGYMEYLQTHRELPDGLMRDWDNWKSGIPIEVYAESLDRHTRTMNLLDEGETVVEDGKETTMLDTLYAIMFNTMGRIYEETRA